MGRTASFLVRWRATILALTLAVALSVAAVGSAKANGSPPPMGVAVHEPGPTAVAPGALESLSPARAAARA
ncbi:MAG TPA: hypothetical protein VKB25_09045 [Conexibacter sp.]|nr:hypothetical protein [Conexibacter sp.]